jgi:hypothetical protein
MKVFSVFLVTSTWVAASVSALQQLGKAGTVAVPAERTRAEFLQQATFVAGVALVSSAQPAQARGRATLEQAYDRYTPRILAGGAFYKSQMRALIANNDWQGIKTALADPPKKTKEDRVKVDGGSSERAAKAGGFSDARVLVACDLFAATFSDNSISDKTRTMKKEVDELRFVVQTMISIAGQGLGEDTGGGLFGFGAKKLSKDEVSRKMKELYLEGGAAWNRYIYAANDGLTLSLQKLPYL